MRQIIKLALVVLFSSIANPILAATKPIINIQHWQTKNGAQVYFVAASELPMLDIEVVFNAGSARDNEQVGLAKATNAMLDEGAGELSADKIAAQFENVGAQYGASVNHDMASVRLRSLSDPKFLNPALQTFTKVLATPNFPIDAWERVRKQILTRIQVEQQSPMQVAINNFFKNLYTKQPYGHPVIGTADTVAKLTSQDLLGFYKQYYVTNNAIVAIVGAIDKQKAVQIAEQITAQLSTGNAATALATTTGSQQAQAIGIDFPGAQTTIMMGQIGINLLNPDYFPLYVGNYTLGGGTLVSRLFEEVRNKRGLTYGVHSKFVPLYAQGPFYIKLQTRNEQASQAIAVTHQTLQNFIQLGPTEQELVAAKKHIIAEFPLNFSSNADKVAGLITLAFYHLPLDYYDTYRQKVAAITVQQVKEAFQRNIQPTRMLVITVGQHPISNKK